MGERVTITVEPSIESGDSLTIQDAMRQVLDFIEVVCAATDDDVRPKISWKLVSATTNSPFTAVAEAESNDPDWPDIGREAKAAKIRASDAFNSIISGGALPPWLQEHANENFRHLFRRNLEDIGKTQLAFFESEPPVVIVERVARLSLNHINSLDAADRQSEPDYSGIELGSIEGRAIEALTHHGRPAIRIRESVSDAIVLCVFPKDMLDKIGALHSFTEVWRGQRVCISGVVKRKKNGEISIVEGDDLRSISSSEIRIDSIADANFTGGLSASEYLADLWGE